MINYIYNFIFKKKENIHGFNYEMDATRWNGIYRKSYEEWKYKLKQYQ